MFLYLGVSGHPLHLYAPYVHMPPYIHMSPGVYTPIYSPYSSVHLYVHRGFCMSWGVVRGFLMCWDASLTPPLYGGASPSVAPPTLSCWLPCALVCFGDIHMSCGHFSLLYGVWGVPPSVGGSGGTSALVMSICSFLYIFVVHYVSHFYYGYDYYSSSYGGIFWPVISLITDSGSSLHRVSSKLQSAWSASTTTLDAKRLWRCYWLSFCATAANSIFESSSGLCQLCYGFSTGRFLFQS